MTSKTFRTGLGSGQGERIKKLINFDRLRPRRDQEC